MSKKQILDEFTTVLAVSLRHKIGNIIMPNALYSEKYARDSEILFNEAQKINEKGNWNYNDKIEIKEELKIKLKKELESKTFLPDEKYKHIDKEIEKALKILSLN